MHQKSETVLSIERQLEKAKAEIMAQREEILRAFIAKYGCDDPAEVVQCEESTINGFRWWVEKKTK